MTTLPLPTKLWNFVHDRQGQINTPTLEKKMGLNIIFAYKIFSIAQFDIQTNNKVTHFDLQAK